MPKVTIWIRKEDEAKWKAIPHKPNWLHEHINASEYVYGSIRVQVAKPGTIDSGTGLEIRDFRFNANPEVDKIYEELVAPTEPHQTFFKDKKK